MACCQRRYSAFFSMPVWRNPISGVAFTTVSPSSSTTTRRTPWVLGWWGPMLRVSRSSSGASWSLGSGARAKASTSCRAVPSAGLGANGSGSRAIMAIPPLRLAAAGSRVGSPAPTGVGQGLGPPGLEKIELLPLGQGGRRPIPGAPQGVILPEGMTLPVIGHQDPPQVGVARKADPEEVIHLPLSPVGRRPEVGDGRHLRRLLRDGHPQLEASRLLGPAVALEGQEVVDHLETGLPGQVVDPA